MVSEQLETRIVERGQKLYDLIEKQSPSIFRKDYWTGKVMDWCMHDEAFKVEMFRFVDVFPALGEAQAVATHLREYFTRPGQQFPEALQWGIKSVAPRSLAAKLLAMGVAKNIESMGRQFIVGKTPEEAMPELGKLRKKGFACTIDLLGEAVVSELEADDYLNRYLTLIDALDRKQRSWRVLEPAGGNLATAADLDWGSSPKVNISVKASAMDSQMSARAFEYSIGQAKERLRPILRRAMEIGAFVNLDMEHQSLKGLTLALYRSLLEEPEFRGYPHTGIAMQAYLRDTDRDVADLIGWAREHWQQVTVRLVKGAYWDAEVIAVRQKNWPVPVFTNKHESDANFETVARRILENHEYAGLACGSHNIRSIASVIEMARELDVPEERVEYQILYGMAEPVRNALKRAGLRLRLYAPVGELIPGMAYLVRRLLENTANESFLRQSFTEAVSHDELLKNPQLFLNGHGGPGAVNGTASNGAAGALATGGVTMNATMNARADTEPSIGLGNEPRGKFHNEPPFDWALAENRERMTAALDSTRRQLPMRVPLIIGGREAVSGRTIRSTNPNKPEEEVGLVASGRADDALQAILAARAAFEKWRDVEPEERADVLFKAADAARRRRYELTALEVFEVGKTWGEADADVCEAIDFFEYYACEMVRLARPQRMGDVPGEDSRLFYEPRGVAAVIAPWNFPLAISAGMVSAAIVSGNTVVYKPSSESPVMGYMLYELFKEAGLPAGVLNYLPGPGAEVGDLLVTRPEVSLIAFTGSKDVGLRIVRLAGETPQGARGVKRVVAEMGGKNAIIVDADADLDEAVVEILHSAFGYQGQKCSACSRLIVLESIHDKLVERLKAAADSLHLGPSEEPQSYMGAVISASAKEKIGQYIRTGKDEGTLVIEKYPDESQGQETRGHFVPLTIFQGIQPRHRLAQEEIFGPVLSIMKVKDFEEALRVANATEFALTGGVFSRSPENIEQAKKRFRVGNLYINRGCTGAIVGRHPFGGFKMSGVGSKAGGPDYLLQFMIPRNVVENTVRRGFAPSE